MFEVKLKIRQELQTTAVLLPKQSYFTEWIEKSGSVNHYRELLTLNAWMLGKEHS